MKNNRATLKEKKKEKKGVFCKAVCGSYFLSENNEINEGF